MVANWHYIKKDYSEHHASALSECRTNQWPLALSKNMELATNSDEQSYYHYPLVRYPIHRTGS